MSLRRGSTQPLKTFLRRKSRQTSPIPPSRENIFLMKINYRRGELTVRVTSQLSSLRSQEPRPTHWYRHGEGTPCEWVRKSNRQGKFLAEGRSPFKDFGLSTVWVCGSPPDPWSIFREAPSGRGGPLPAGDGGPLGRLGPWTADLGVVSDPRRRSWWGVGGVSCPGWRPWGGGVVSSRGWTEILGDRLGAGRRPWEVV